jgi:uncharacterized protein
MNKGFQIIWKTTHNCNFACKYCHYEEIMNSQDGFMELELAELFIKKISRSTHYSNVTFTFHGGEPLTLGLDYYEKIVCFIKRYLKGEKYSLNFQTNGSLINKDIIEFAKVNKIYFSISLDGPKEIHDLNRVYKNGAGTYEKIRENLKLLYDTGTKYSLLTVHSELMKDSNVIYSFFKSIEGSHFTDFLPMRQASFDGLYQSNYGNFMIELFDLWFNDSEYEFDVRLLTVFVKRLLGIYTALCTFRETCVTEAEILTVDPVGNAYPCDNDTYHNYLLGNIKDNEIDELMRNHPIRKKLALQRLKKYESCRFCNWYSICHGGCPDHYNSVLKRNAYCLDYQKILSHIQAVLKDYSILDENGKLNIGNINKIPNKCLKKNIKKEIFKDKPLQNAQ